LEEEDLKNLPVENDQYRFYNVLEAVLIKYQTTLNLNEARQRFDRKVRMIRSKNINKKSEKKLNEEKARFEQRTPLKDAPIQEAKRRLFNQYQTTFDLYFEKYKTDIEAWADSVDLLIEYIFVLVKDSIASRIGSDSNDTKQIVLIILNRQPKLFELFLKQMFDKANNDTIKLVKFIKTNIDNLNNELEKEGFGDIREQITSNWIVYASNDQNSFGFEVFRNSYLKQLDKNISQLIQTLNYSELRKLLSIEKFKEIVLEITGQENLFYFKDLKLEKK